MTFGFWTLLIIPKWTFKALLCNIATVKHWTHETVSQYILIAAGNIAVMGNDRKGMNLKILTEKLLQIFNERNHERHGNILLIHCGRVSNWQGH